MKTLIVYYSKTGNTERVANKLATKLGADLEKLVDQKKRHGILGWLMSGRDGMKKAHTNIDEPSKNPADYDLVILGTPIWGWNITPALRTYMNNHKDHFKKIAFFMTCGSTKMEKIMPFVKEIVNLEPAASLDLNAGELRDKDVYDKKINDFINIIKQLN